MNSSRPSIARRLVATSLLLASVVQAQSLLSGPDPDWKEGEVPAPPAFRADRAIPIEGVPGASLTFGVDPDTLSIGRDGIVRYVVVVRNPAGAVTGLYEGLRCASGEVRTYARHNGPSGWALDPQPTWRSLFGGSSAVRHSMWLARNGLCEGVAPPLSIESALTTLRGQNRERTQ